MIYWWYVLVTVVFVGRIVVILGRVTPSYKAQATTCSDDDGDKKIQKKISFVYNIAFHLGLGQAASFFTSTYLYAIYNNTLNAQWCWSQWYYNNI